jgi:hypothetical protein
MRSHYDSRGSVHEHRSCEPDTPGEGECLLGHSSRPAYLARHSTAVCSEHNLGVEHREQRVEVNVARGSKEGIDGFSLANEISVGNRGSPSHPAACTARELSCCGRGAVHDGGDLVEGHGEHVMLEHREQRGSN